MPLAVNYNENVTEQVLAGGNCTELFLKTFDNTYSYSSTFFLGPILTARILGPIYQGINYFSRITDLCHAILDFSSLPSTITTANFEQIYSYTDNITSRYDNLFDKIHKYYYFQYYFIALVACALVIFLISYISFSHFVNKPIIKEESTTIGFLASKERLALLLLEMSLESWNLLTTLFPIPKKTIVQKYSSGTIPTLNSNTSSAMNKSGSGEMNDPNDKRGLHPLPHPSSRLRGAGRRRGSIINAQGNKAVHNRQCSYASTIIDTEEPQVKKSSRHVNLKDTKISVSFIDDFIDKGNITPPAELADQYLNQRTPLNQGTKLTRQLSFSTRKQHNSQTDLLNHSTPDIVISQPNNESTRQSYHQASDLYDLNPESSPIKEPTPENLDLVETSIKETLESNSCLSRYFFWIILTPWIMTILHLLILFIPIAINTTNENNLIKASEFNNSQALSVLRLFPQLGYLLLDPSNETGRNQISELVSIIDNPETSSVFKTEFYRERCYTLNLQKICNTTKQFFEGLLDGSLNFSFYSTDSIAMISHLTNYSYTTFLNLVSYQYSHTLDSASSPFSFFVSSIIIWGFITSLFFIVEYYINDAINSLMHFPHQYFSQLEDAKKMIELSDMNSNVIYVTTIIQTGEIYSISDNVEVLLGRLPITFIGTKLDEEFAITENEANTKIRVYNYERKQRKFVYEDIKFGHLMCTALIDDSRIVIDKRQDNELIQEFSNYLPVKFAKLYYEQGQVDFDFVDSTLFGITLNPKLSTEQKDPFYTVLHNFTQKFPNIHIILASGDLISLVIEKSPLMLQFVLIRDIITEGKDIIYSVLLSHTDLHLHLVMDNEPFMLPSYKESLYILKSIPRMKYHELRIVNFPPYVFSSYGETLHEGEYTAQLLSFDEFLQLMARTLQRNS